MTSPFVLDEATGLYNLSRPASPADVLRQAEQHLATKLATRPPLSDPSSVRLYLALAFADLEHEEFICLQLDCQHRLLSTERAFKGTVNACSVYPREIVKSALRANAAAVIFAHNHPSGVSEPSQADRHLTDRLKTALQLVDIQVLDHFVVGRGTAVSFAERGWI